MMHTCQVVFVLVCRYSAHMLLVVLASYLIVIKADINNVHRLVMVLKTSHKNPVKKYGDKSLVSEMYHTALKCGGIGGS